MVLDQIAADAAFVMPPDACDAHCHVFGPQAVFPYAPERPYTPQDATKEDLARLHRRLGISRTVIIQPACYGTDHSALLDAIADDPGRRRGIAILDARADEDEVARLHEGGVRGVRFNFVGHLGERPDAGTIGKIVDLVGPFGWHVALHLNADDLSANAQIFELPVPIVIDHMARLDAAAGLDQRPLCDLLRLLDRENCWIKVSGADRVSARRGTLDDAAQMASILLEAAPDRVLWGTDWPHPNVAYLPDDELLAQLVPTIARTRDKRRRMLIDNPQRLYGFDQSEVA